MATINFSDKTESNSVARCHISDVDLATNVETLGRNISEKIGKPTHEFQLVHAGRRLKAGHSLRSLGIKDGSTIYLLRSILNEPETTPSLDQVEVKQVITAFQVGLVNSTFRNTVDALLNKQETLENIMAATPGLSSDPVAIAMLQSPELLRTLADPQHINGVLERHPALGHAAMYIAAAVSEEGTKPSAATSANSRATYSLDQMSDDEEMMDTSSQSRQQAITPSQLAAALAMASGATPSTSRTDDSQGISSNFLQQALSQASGASATAPTPAPGGDPFQAQLEQLRAMGIQDEVVARHALEAAGGNLTAAIQILFGDSST